MDSNTLPLTMPAKSHKRFTYECVAQRQNHSSRGETYGDEDPINNCLTKVEYGK